MKGTSDFTDIYWSTSELATMDADIRFAGSTEYSALTFLIARVCVYVSKQSYNIVEVLISWSLTRRILTKACKFSNFLMESTCFGSEVNGQSVTISALSLLGSACR